MEVLSIDEPSVSDTVSDKPMSCSCCICDCCKDYCCGHVNLALADSGATVLEFELEALEEELNNSL